jgi:hypothetical protein
MWLITQGELLMKKQERVQLMELEQLEIAPLTDDSLSSVTGGCGGMSLFQCSGLICVQDVAAT